MKLAHTITISVFLKTGENEQKIKSALIRMIPMDIEKEKIKLNEIDTPSNEGATKKIFEIKLAKGKHVADFLEYLNSKISKEEREMLARQYLTRVDEELNFFLRLEKKGILNDEYKITDSGECFHVKIHLAAYPAKVELGKEAVKQIFK